MRYVSAVLVLAASGAAAPVPAFDGSIGAVYSAGITDGAAYERGTVLKLRYAQSLGGFELRAEARHRWNDAACDASAPACDAYRAHFDWRELYLARTFGDWQWSAGLQQVVWGRADNLRVFDLVNPLDLRDYVLPDLGDYRLAVPMLRGLGPVGEWTVEAVWLPYFTPTRFAAAGSPYDLDLPGRIASLGLLPEGERRPSRNVRNGEVGVQLSTTRGALDISLLGFSGWNDDPVYALDDPARVAVGAQYRRQMTFGLGLAYALESGWVLRGESTFTPDAAYSALGQVRGVARAGTWNVLAGADYTWRDWVFSFQLNDRWIDDWHASYGVPEHASIATASATGTTHRGRFTHRLAYSVMPQNGDGAWLQWRSAWQFNDRWQLEGTLDLLSGDDTGFFGQFRDRDRLRLELRRQF
ncbi:DUF1302 family protein [Tahibacter amnicola]|uniref:Porin n=1 Tax=Tahibacter amnicola TaxID=2976241 RepID=A0ABY6BGF7_9GAMM|nr:DUF1302 family protein [Tahibacter amnicola]UXI69109.1 hypothetical protein N4264_05515 [Tahibacter amnicola]